MHFLEIAASDDVVEDHGNTQRADFHGPTRPILDLKPQRQMVNVIAPIMTNKQGLFLQPIYFPIVEYGKQRGNTSLDLFVSAPTYQIQNRPPLRYLEFQPVTTRRNTRSM